MLKLVDKLDLGSSAKRRKGSSPFQGTTFRDVVQLARTHALGA